MSSSKTPLATRIVDRMLDNDPFSQWLGIERVEDGAGRSVLRMTIRKEMLNGFDLMHGGIAFSLADSALAFAANGHNRMSLSIETSMSYLEGVKEGDTITAVAEEAGLTQKTGIYYITISKTDGTRVALFKGTVYRTSKEWFEDE
jgi:acyl-CoA thioesterase